MSKPVMRKSRNFTVLNVSGSDGNGVTNLLLASFSKATMRQRTTADRGTKVAGQGALCSVMQHLHRPKGCWEISLRPCLLKVEHHPGWVLQVLLPQVGEATHGSTIDDSVVC